MSDRAVVFDLDGTLINSAPAIQHGVNRAMVHLGIEPLSLVDTTSFIGNGLPVLVRRVMEKRGIPDDSFDEIYRVIYGFYEESSVGELHFYPGALEMLEQLDAAGFKLGLCTNKPLALAKAILETAGVSARLPVVIGGDSLPVRKPDPAPLRIAIAGLGCQEAVFVGDSEIDAETAERAAVPFVLFTGGYAKRPIDQINAAASFAHHDQAAEIIAALETR